VWAAVTPLALDLTVHAGKGLTPTAARVSAVMEAIERVCAERVDPGRVRRATFAELAAAGEPALDPELFDLPFETEYESQLPIDWVAGQDLIGGAEVWVALDLVRSPARDGVCHGVDTNGLAAGNNRTEAVLHALYELVERDALARVSFARRYARDDRLLPLCLIEQDSLPPAVAERVAGLCEHGLQASFQDLSHELGVPVFQATLYDRAFPGSEGRVTAFEGLGCDLEPEWALQRALCEAVQSHTVLVVGARDTIEDGEQLVRHNAAALLRRLATPICRRPVPSAPESLPGDMCERAQLLLARLAGTGIEHCVVIDLTREQLGIPVVRVLAPGLSGPFGHSNRRPAARLLATLL